MMLFHHLILPGGDTRINLSSNSLVHRFITDGVANMNAINDKSIQICPSLYLDEDLATNLAAIVEFLWTVACAPYAPGRLKTSWYDHAVDYQLPS